MFSFLRKKKSMFINVTINLTGPICNCDEQNIEWSLPTDNVGHTTMSLTCKTCFTKLIVSHSKLVANFNLGKDYPNKIKKKEKDAKILKFIPGEKEDDPPKT